MFFFYLIFLPFPVSLEHFNVCPGVCLPFNKRYRTTDILLIVMRLAVPNILINLIPRKYHRWRRSKSFGDGATIKYLLIRSRVSAFICVIYSSLNSNPKDFTPSTARNLDVPYGLK